MSGQLQPFHRRIWHLNINIQITILHPFFCSNIIFLQEQLSHSTLSILFQIKIIYIYCHHMNKSLSEIASSTISHRNKTDRLQTQASELYIPFSSRRIAPETPSYLKITTTKTNISLSRGYLDLQRRKKRAQTQKQSVPRDFANNKFIVFRNLQEFQVNIQTKEGLIGNNKSYGLATFKGTQRSISLHQVGLHIGSLSILALCEGYDGMMAANTVRKKFPTFLLQTFRKMKSERQMSFPIVQKSIGEAIQRTTNDLIGLQQSNEDSSGTSLSSLIIYDGILYVLNCGQSAVWCNTNNGKLLKMAKPHTTNNEGEVDRIIKQGGRMYRTIVNVPFKKDLNIKGPLRVYPSGLTLTRTLGKTRELLSQRSQIASNKTVKGISNTPQIQYLPESEVDWVMVVSSQVDQNIKKERLKEIVNQQLAKSTNMYSNGLVAEHVCKRVMLQAVESGVGESVSAILIIFKRQDQPKLNNETQRQKKVVQQSKQNKTKQSWIRQQKQKQKQLTHQPRSLTYIGNRKNFVQQIRLE